MNVRKQGGETLKQDILSQKSGGLESPIVGNIFTEIKTGNLLVPAREWLPW